MKNLRHRHGQRGVTLLVGLIMLVLMTLMALAVFNLGRSNLQIVGNMQSRNDNYNVSQQALEQVISNANFLVPSAALALLPNGTNTQGYDINGDGIPDVTVSIGSSKDPTKPTCIQAQIVPNTSLKWNSVNDVACMVTATGGSQSAVAALCQSLILQKANTTDPTQLAALNDAINFQGCSSVSPPTGNSQCATTLWDIQATATDNITQATVVSNVGVSVRMPSPPGTDVATICP
jgi:Tfp pilus assembly protein PilX